MPARMQMKSLILYSLLKRQLTHDTYLHKTTPFY